MEWLEPWWSTEGMDEHFHETFRRELELEVSPQHPLYRLTVKLVARGNGDDALFQILDGSGRYADVHLTWIRKQDRFPWPHTGIYANLEEWVELVMLPQNREWVADS